jgi:Na+/pantothenate symporter
MDGRSHYGSYHNPYTVYGGFRSVVYTDVIQAVLMIITLIMDRCRNILPDEPF